MTPEERVELEAAMRKSLEEDHGFDVYDTAELQEDFIVEAFAAPFVRVRRKKDGVVGWMSFHHSPRFYFHFTPE